MVEREFELKLGIPHTNYQGAAEHLLMAWLGWYQWETIGDAIGVPLMRLRSQTGRSVYATFFYIQSTYSEDSSLRFWKPDEKASVLVRAASYKNVMIDSSVALRGSGGKRADFRMCNVFISPEKDNLDLKFSPPANGDFTALASLTESEAPMRLNRDFKQHGHLELFGSPAAEVGRKRLSLQLTPERDTNGAGLVYFANYYAYLNVALRDFFGLKKDAALPGPLERRVIYLNNVSPWDEIAVDTRYLGEGNIVQEIHRRMDQKRICYSEARLEPDLIPAQELVERPPDLR